MEDWQQHAICFSEGPELFVPSVEGKRGRTGGEELQSMKLAKKICIEECTVKVQCLKFALENDMEYGVWGGTLPAERKKLRRAMKPPRPRRRAAVDI